MLPPVLPEGEEWIGDHMDVDVGAEQEEGEGAKEVVSHQPGDHLLEMLRRGRGGEILQEKQGMNEIGEMRETEMAEAKVVRDRRKTNGASGMIGMIGIPGGSHPGLQSGQATSRLNLRGRPDRGNGNGNGNGNGMRTSIAGGVGMNVM
jgi:hypothetical protein